MAVDVAPAIIGGDPYEAATVYGTGDVGECGPTVLGVHSCAEGAQPLGRQTLVVVPLEPMRGPVLVPCRIPLVVVVAPEVIDAFMQEPLRFVGTHQVQGQAVLEQQPPGPVTLGPATRLPAKLAIDPPGVGDIGNPEHIQNVGNHAGQA